MNRKYPETTGYYCYCHITPDEMFYIGMSNQKPAQRWKPSKYKNGSLGPYIDKYGWVNIRHVILKDGLTKEQAEQLEGLLIQEAKLQGFCLNKKMGDGVYRDIGKEYYQLPHYKKHKSKYNYEYQQRPEVKEHRREYMRQWRLKKKALKN